VTDISLVQFYLKRLCIWLYSYTRGCCMQIGIFFSFVNTTSYVSHRKPLIFLSHSHYVQMRSYITCTYLLYPNTFSVPTRGWCFRINNINFVCFHIICSHLTSNTYTTDALVARSTFHTKFGWIPYAFCILETPRTTFYRQVPTNIHYPSDVYDGNGTALNFTSVIM